MKLSAIILMFILYSSAIAQKKDTTTAFISFGFNSCMEIESDNNAGVYSIKLISLQNNHVEYHWEQTEKKREYENYLIANALPVGKYRLSYTTFRGVVRDKYFTIKPIPLNYITLCSFKNNVEPINPFVGLKENDSVVLKIGSFGCTYHSLYDFIVKKDKKGFFCYVAAYSVKCPTADEDITIKVSPKPTTISESKRLNQKEIESLVQAINKTIMISSSGCTSHTSFELKYDNNKIKFDDLRCAFYLESIIRSKFLKYNSVMYCEM